MLRISLIYHKGLTYMQNSYKRTFLWPKIILKNTALIALIKC